MKSKPTKLKLNIEVVPSTSWCHNLREVLPKSEWDKIRKRTYAEYGHKCGICGIEGRLNCHEIWEYDDEKHVQKLVGFIALCDMCHNVKHIGRSAEVGLYDEVTEHFMKVNNCDKKTFKAYERKVFDEYRRRSQYEWHVDLGEYEKVIRSAGKG